MPTPRNCLAGLAVIALAGIATCAVLAAADDAQTNKPPEVASRGPREAKDVTFGDWQKLCFKAGGAPKLCRTSITGKFPTGQVAVRVDLIEREDAPTARLQLFLPVGMYLQKSPKLTVDQGQPQQLPYNWCLTNMCIAADVAAPAFIKEMESGKALALEVVDSSLLALTTSVPLTQFAAAHKGEPVKTFEQYVDE